MFGSMVGFSRSADRMVLFPAGSATILKNSNGDISLFAQHSLADHPIYSVFGSRMGFSGLADRMALFPVSPNPRSS